MDAHVLGMGLIGFGVIQLVGLIVFGALRWIEGRGRIRIVATLVDHEAYESDNGTYYRPIYEYAAPDGTLRRVRRDVGLPHRLAADGSERRPVWHDPADPNRSRVALAVVRPALRIFFLLPFVVLAAGLALRFGLFG